MRSKCALVVVYIYCEHRGRSVGWLALQSKHDDP